MTEPTEEEGTATGTARRSDEGYWAKPVRRITTKEVPVGATDLISGRRLYGATSGFGRLWQKSFWARLEGTSVTPQEVIRVWKERFGDFWPKNQRMFLPAAGIAPGEVGLIKATPMRGAPATQTGVLVVYADAESFSFMSPEGHPFAGTLTFSASDEDGITVVRVDELTRASDPMWELAMMTPIIGKRMQNAVWLATLKNVALHFGVDTRVESRIVCVDSKRQWSQAKNIVYNAGIRSTLHTFVRPFRRR